MQEGFHPVLENSFWNAACAHDGNGRAAWSLGTGQCFVSEGVDDADLSFCSE